MRIEALEEWRLCEPSESRWCFGFHNSCWRLLLLRLGHGQDDCLQNETAIAESVSYQLYCTPCLESSRFQFGHDYEGSAQTHKSFGRPKATDLRLHFYAAPCVIPSIDDLKAAASDFRKAPDGSLWKGRDGARLTTRPWRALTTTAKGPPMPLVRLDSMTTDIHPNLLVIRKKKDVINWKDLSTYLRWTLAGAEVRDILIFIL